MSISTEEANKAYAELAGTCASVGLDWVLHQVEEKKAVGRVTATKLSKAQLRVSDELWHVAVDSPRGTSRQPAVFMVAQDYSAQESLSILVDALLAAIVQSHDAGNAVFACLEDFRGHSVAFAPETAVGELRELPRELILRRQPEIDRLNELLTELKKELDDAPPSRTDL